MAFTDPYINTDRCVNRLFKDYLKHGSLIVAFDFDNTIFDTFDTGEEYNEVISLLKSCSKDFGFTMVLYTVDDDPKSLEFKKNFTEKIGIKIDYVNESIIFKESTKIYYNILLDDRAGLGQSVNILKLTLQKILEYRKTTKNE